MIDRPDEDGSGSTGKEALNAAAEAAEMSGVQEHHHGRIAVVSAMRDQHSGEDDPAVFVLGDRAGGGGMVYARVVVAVCGAAVANG
jgi:hypothetical protein